MISNNKIVLYIISDVRSGSTLLENILSRSSEIISVGELHQLYGHMTKTGPGHRWNWNCSCGEEIKNCTFWNKIIYHFERENNQSIKQTKIDYSKVRVNPIWDNMKLLNADENRQIIEQYKKIYSAVFKIYQPKIIVDSSKEYLLAYLLHQESDFNVKFIYLKRDIRAVSISKFKWYKKNTGRNTSLYKILLATKLNELKREKIISKMNQNNLLKLTYEELANYPQQTTDKICNFINCSKFNVPKDMYLENNHTVGGSPDRMSIRPIQYDDSWIKTAKSKPLFNLAGKLFSLYKITR